MTTVFTHGDNILGNHVDAWIWMIDEGRFSYPKFIRKATKQEIEDNCKEE